MSEFAGNRAAQEQIEEVSLTENRFEIASENVEHDDISKEMPRASIKHSSGHELPRICVQDSPVA